MREISVELQESVRSNPRVENVYFDASGRHYFYAHLLCAGKDDKEKPKLYGQGEFSHKLKTEIKKGGTVIDEVSEDIARGVSATLIVETISRADVLAATPKRESSALISQILGMSEDERRQLIAILGGGVTNVTNTSPAQPAAPPASTVGDKK